MEQVMQKINQIKELKEKISILEKDIKTLHYNDNKESFGNANEIINVLCLYENCKSCKKGEIHDHPHYCGCCKCEKDVRH